MESREYGKEMGYSRYQERDLRMMPCRNQRTKPTRNNKMGLQFLYINTQCVCNVCMEKVLNIKQCRKACACVCERERESVLCFLVTVGTN